MRVVILHARSPPPFFFYSDPAHSSAPEKKEKEKKRKKRGVWGACPPLSSSFRLSLRRYDETITTPRREGQASPSSSFLLCHLFYFVIQHTPDRPIASRVLHTRSPLPKSLFPLLLCLARRHHPDALRQFRLRRRASTLNPRDSVPW